MPASASERMGGCWWVAVNVAMVPTAFSPDEIGFTDVLADVAKSHTYRCLAGWPFPVTALASFDPGEQPAIPPWAGTSTPRFGRECSAPTRRSGP